MFSISNAQAPQAGDRGGHVGPRGEMGDRGDALSESAEQGVAVGDGFVAWDGDHAVNGGRAGEMSR